MQLVLLNTETVTIKSALVTQQLQGTLQPHQLPAELKTSTTNTTLRHNISNKQGRDTHFKIDGWPISL